MNKFFDSLIGFCVALLLLGFVSNHLSAQEKDTEPAEPGKDVWVTGIEKAIEQAKAEKKDLLLNFTGSDWCKYCIKLEGEVLGKKEFLDAAKKKYIMVMVDFPTDKSDQSDALQKSNETWKQKFSVSGFPTLVLLDTKQRPYGFLGYREGGVQPFLDALNELHGKRIKRDEFFAKAEKAKGVEKAKLLDQALQQMNEDVITVYYEKIVDEIVKLDANNEAGLRNKYREAKYKELYKAVITDVTMISRLQKPEKAIEFIDEVVAKIELPPAYLLRVYQMKFDLLRKTKQIVKAEKLIDTMLKIDGVADDTILTQRLLVRKAYLLAGAKRRDDAYKMLDEKIKEMKDNLYLYVAKGELLDAEGKYNDAIAAFDKAINTGDSDPELMQKLHSAKSDALFELKKYDQAVEVLTTFAADETWPADLRADALLHKAIILREQAKIEKKSVPRSAIIAENKAIEIVETPQEKAELQKLVEKLRARYEKDNGSD